MSKRDKFSASHLAGKVASLLLAGSLLVTSGAAESTAFARGRDRIDVSTPVRAVEKTAEKKVKVRPGSVASITPTRIDQIQKLKKHNPDTVGWLQVPGTRINSVIVHRPTSRNLYYSDRNFYGDADKNGAFFADYRSTFGTGEPEKLARNTVLYGHSWTDNMNGDQFAQVKRYRNTQWAKEHPYIFFSTEKEDMAWEVFAVYEAHVNFPYNQSTPHFGFTPQSQLDAMRDSSIYTYGVNVTTEDKILTLSTCAYSLHDGRKLSTDNDYRFVIAAKLVDPDAKLKSRANFTINPAPASPDKYNLLVEKKTEDKGENLEEPEGLPTVLPVNQP